MQYDRSMLSRHEKIALSVHLPDARSCSLGDELGDAGNLFVHEMDVGDLRQTRCVQRLVIVSGVRTLLPELPHAGDGVDVVVVTDNDTFVSDACVGGI